MTFSNVDTPKTAPKVKPIRKTIHQNGFSKINFRRRIKNKAGLRATTPSFSESMITGSRRIAKRELDESIVEYLFSLNERSKYNLDSHQPDQPGTPKPRTKRAEGNYLTGYIVLRAYVSKFIQSKAGQRDISRDVRRLWDSLPEIEKNEWNKIAEVYRFQHKSPDIDSNFHVWLEEHLSATTAKDLKSVPTITRDSKT